MWNAKKTITYHKKPDCQSTGFQTTWPKNENKGQQLCDSKPLCKTYQHQSHNVIARKLKTLNFKTNG